MERFWRVILAASLLFTSVVIAPVHALVPSPADSPSVEIVPEPQIVKAPEANADSLIAERISDIFGQLPSLSAATVTVNEGVVSLSGIVPDAAAIDRAETIASRVDGVVTVENSLERDVSVDGNLGALGGLSDRLDGFAAMLPLIAVALIVTLIISLIGYLIAGLGSLWRKITPNNFLAELIASAIRFVFVVGGLVIGLDMIGAGALLGAVLGGAGVVGIALGFAMRETIENYVASLMLSLRQPFRANDHVMIDDLEGRVIRLTSRATVLMTLDGNHLRVPNSTVFKAVIINFTRNPQRRFDFDLGIDAEDDAGDARRLGVEILQGLDFVLKTPPPTAQVEQVGASNIVIKFLGWIDQSETDWNKARSEAIPAVKDALEEAGFALPEPIYRLRFDAGAPLPIGSAQLTETVASQGTDRSKPVPSRRKKMTVSLADADVSPDTEVENMVDAERAVSADEDDLLDAGRPVE